MLSNTTNSTNATNVIVNETVNRNLKVWDAADSLIRDKPLIYRSRSHRTREYTRRLFPLASDELEYHHFVRSPVIVINDTGKADDALYRFPLYL